VKVSLDGIKRLSLVADDADGDMSFDHADWAEAVFTLSGAAPVIHKPKTEPYILTPKQDDRPRINGATVFGVRPGSPFLFTIAATGTRPMTFGAEGLPASVMVVEPLGSHALVTAKVAGTPVKIEAPVDIALKTDEAIHLAFDEARARWMAGDTGAAIGPV